MADILTPKQNSAVARAIRNPDLRVILFRKASGVQWFNAFNEAGFFVPEEIPMPVPAKEEGYVDIPVWPITEYLVATSKQFIDPHNEVYAKNVLAFIRAATIHAREQRFGNCRAWWQFSKIIRNIPPHLIHANDLELIDYWLDDKYERGLVAENVGVHWLIGLLDRDDEHCKAIALGLLNILYKILYVEKQHGDLNRKEVILRFDSWYAKKITEKVAPRAGQVLGQPAVDIFRNKFEDILKALNNDKWSYLWRPAIENNEQNHAGNDAEDILIEGIRDALLAFIDGAPDAAKLYISDLLNSPFEAIKRIAICVIDKRYQQLNELIGQVIVEPNYTSNLHHEMWYLLRNHFMDFSAAEKALVQKVITSFNEVDADGMNREGATAYQRAIWLSAIKDYGEDLKEKYQQCVAIIGSEPEHPELPNYVSVGWVGDKSPITKDELLSMEVDQLVNWLNLYKDPGQFGEPGIEGLVRILREAMKTEPVRYIDLLHKFSSLDLAYIDAILEAYGELWNEKVALPWDEAWQHLLVFSANIVQQKIYLLTANTKGNSALTPNRHRVVGSIAGLIESGTKSDEHAFSKKYLDQARTILLTLLENEERAEFLPDSDAVLVSINSPRGRCIQAYINLSLRYCRLAKKEGKHFDVWGTLEPTYNAALAQASNGEYEFATLIVYYLPNFLYMSKEWVLANLTRIFDQDNYQKWLCAMNGYAYVSPVYEGIYKHLKNNGHLLRALDDDNLKKRVYEKIIQNIAVAYLNNYETLKEESSLISQLLTRKKYNELSQLIWFLWTLRKSEIHDFVGKIYELWAHLLDAIDTNTKEGRKLASSLCDWSVFIDVVDNRSKNLIFSVAPFAGEDYNSHELLVSIARISEKQPIEAYEVWCRLLEGTSTDFPEEAIRSALTNLIRVGPDGIRKAKDIVSRYLKYGVEGRSTWLQEIIGEANL